MTAMLIPADKRVYPRARGGTAAPTSLTATGWGLSPRTRGNPPSLLPWQGSPGSIPAHAGEPLNESLILTIHEVYPRARGGTMTLAYLLYLHWGLSPRTRGNRGGGTGRFAPAWSIPAHAGEPDETPVQRPGEGVYPRARGGTFACHRHASSNRGLSPRTRGNHSLAF